jgi:hypothetical protein
MFKFIFLSKKETVNPVVTSYEHYNESSALGYGKDDKSFVELKDW